MNDSRPAGGGEHTFKQFVTDDSTYFHPFGVSGWPESPPNFLAFRWGNSVQRIHRVVDAEVVPRLVDRWPDIPVSDDTIRPHAVYKLGPRIPPMTPIPSGTTYRAARLWVLLDQLQVQPTLKDAVASSKALRDRGR